jgi:ribonuclease HII
MIIAGVDEVGRGPLAGPVLASAVVLNPKKKILGLKDSKKLTESNRKQLALAIKQKALCWSIGIASVKEIDTLNILNASLLAMKRAINNLPLKPDTIWIDGNCLPDCNPSIKTMIKGDDLIPVISAASIVAKVTRDYLMRLFHTKHPQYGFDQNKGYATSFHLMALEKFGYTLLHRKSFAPVQKLIKENEC